MSWVDLPESAPPTVDDAEIRNGAFPRYGFWRRPVDVLNRALAHPRVLLCQHVPLGDWGAGDLDPMYVYRHLANRGQGRHLTIHVEAGAQVTGTAGDHRLVDNTGAITIRSDLEEAVPAEAPDTSSHAGDMIVAPAGLTDRTIRRFAGFRPVALAVLEGSRHQNRLDSDDGPVVPPARITPGTTIVDADTEEIEVSFQDGWDTHRKTLAAWSARGLAIAQAKSVTATAGVFQNAIDFAAHAYSATSAGLICPTRYVGRGVATTVLASCYVYAEATAAGAGTVRFESGAAAGNVQDVTIGVAKGWYATAVKLALRTTVAYEKIDVALDASAGNTLRVWAWTIIEDP